MRMNRFFKTMGPFVALAALGALAGCNNIRWGDTDGLPLAELDLSGEAPEEVALIGPDTVSITEGSQFTVTVEGDAAVADRLRFKLEDGTLGIMRENGEWSDRSVATVHITMPAPRKLAVAGSGKLTSASLASDAEVSIAGSGTLETPAVDTTSLEVSIAGSGTYVAAGRTGELELSIAGSGSGRMEGLKADSAEISIAGSGDAIFASDGEVEANIMGSGVVTVRGSARCKVNSVGSGSLVCERAPEPAN